MSADFDHVRAGAWMGGVSSPTRPLVDVFDRPGIHLLRESSNSAFTGFRSPAEARAYRQRLEDGDRWHIVIRNH